MCYIHHSTEDRDLNDHDNGNSPFTAALVSGIRFLRSHAFDFNLDLNCLFCEHDQAK
jgi:hypothetical protein